MHVRRLEDGTALQVARDEARAIRAAIPRVKPGTPLRLHTAGDCRTAAAARTVAAAAREWPGPVWTYTHAWRTVPRDAWGESVSVLGSSERLADALDAMARGYTPALVVGHHASGRAFSDGGVRWIPCPAQTRPDVTCRDCRLCWNDARPGAWGITFAVHGRSSKRALTVLQ